MFTTHNHLDEHQNQTEVYLRDHHIRQTDTEDDNDEGRSRDMGVQYLGHSTHPQQELSNGLRQPIQMPPQDSCGDDIFTNDEDVFGSEEVDGSVQQRRGVPNHDATVADDDDANDGVPTEIDPLLMSSRRSFGSHRLSAIRRSSSIRDNYKSRNIMKRFIGFLAMFLLSILLSIGIVMYLIHRHQQQEWQKIYHKQQKFEDQAKYSVNVLNHMTHNVIRMQQQQQNDQQGMTTDSDHDIEPDHSKIIPNQCTSKLIIIRQCDHTHIIRHYEKMKRRRTRKLKELTSSQWYYILHCNYMGRQRSRYYATLLSDDHDDSDDPSMKGNKMTTNSDSISPNGTMMMYHYNATQPQPQQQPPSLRSNAPFLYAMYQERLVKVAPPTKSKTKKQVRETAKKVNMMLLDLRYYETIRPIAQYYYNGTNNTPIHMIDVSSSSSKKEQQDNCSIALSAQQEKQHHSPFVCEYFDLLASGTTCNNQMTILTWNRYDIPNLVRQLGCSTSMNSNCHNTFGDNVHDYDTIWELTYTYHYDTNKNNDNNTIGRSQNGAFNSRNDASSTNLTKKLWKKSNGQTAATTVNGPNNMTATLPQQQHETNSNNNNNDNPIGRWTLQNRIIKMKFDPLQYGRSNYNIANEDV